MYRPMIDSLIDWLIDYQSITTHSRLQITHPIIAQLAHPKDGSVAEWLLCWTQAQKGQGSNRSRDAVG